MCSWVFWVKNLDRAERVDYVCSMMSGTSARVTQTAGVGITLGLLYPHVGFWAGMTQTLAAAGTVDQSIYS